MPKKKSIASDEPLIKRPHRNMKAKIVFDPSDNYLPKKRNKLSIKKSISAKKKNGDTHSKSITINELFDSQENEISSSPTHSLIIKSPVKPVKHTIPEKSLDSSFNCFICSTYKPKMAEVDCPICSIKAHRECINAKEPMWNFMMDMCPWFCKICRNKYCSKCLKNELPLEIKCITCKIGLHKNCYNDYDIKPFQLLSTDKYICLPCMTLATERLPEIEDVEDKEKDEYKVIPPFPTYSNIVSPCSSDDLNSITSNNSNGSHGSQYKRADESRRSNIPNTVKWTKYEVYDYLIEYLPVKIATKIIEHEIDGNALQLLQRTDVTLHMGLKLGAAMKLYKQIRIIQAQSIYPSVYWE